MLSWFHQHVCVCVHVIPWIEVGSKAFPMEFCANFAFRDWQLVANQRKLQPKVLEAWQGPIGHQLQLQLQHQLQLQLQLQEPCL